MNKQQLSERDICSKYILPALKRAGWDLHLQIREEFELTRGRITVRGKLVSRAPARRADIVLCVKPNIPVAVIEAKSNRRSLGAGHASEDAEMAFAQTAVGLNRHARMRRSDALRRRPRAPEVTAQKARKPHAGKALSNAYRLRPALGRQRAVVLALVAFEGVPLRLTVADEQQSRC